MDQMLEQIKSCARHTRPLGEDELEQVAYYLMGKIPFESVAPILPKAGNRYYYAGFYEYTGQIAEACKDEPALLPRLGRHLRAIRHINRESYLQLADHMVGQLSEEQVFLSSGLGAPALLDWLFGDGRYGPLSPDILDTLEREYPGEIEAYINTAPGWILMPLAYLCARRGLDLRLCEGAGLDALLARELLSAAVVTANAWRRQREVREALERCLPGAGAVFDKGVSDSMAKLTKEQKRMIPDRLLRAMALTGFRLPGVGALARALCAADHKQFFDRLYEAMCVSAGEPVSLLTTTGYYPGSVEDAAESVGNQLARLEAAAGKIGLEPAYLPAWASNYMAYSPHLWRRVFRERFGGVDLLKRSYALAAPMEKAMLARELYDLTGSLPNGSTEACCTLLAQRAAGAARDGEVGRVTDWLLGRTDGDPGDLPGLDAFYEACARYYQFGPPQFDPDYAFWALAGAHPIAERYLRYVAAGGRGRHVECCANQLPAYHDMNSEAAAKWMAACSPPQDILTCLACRETINGDTLDTPAKQVYRALVKLRPEAAAAALGSPGADAAARLCLLETLYTAHPGYDSSLLIHCLEDKSKKVRQYALSFLLPKKELADRIRPLLEAKKKDLREAAQRLLAAYEGEASPGADTDVVALCTRSIPKSGTASIRWAFPGDIPPVRWREGGEKADDIVAHCYLTLMLTAKTMEPPPGATSIRQALNEDDLRDIATQVFDQWLADGASTKQKGALLLYGIHAGDSDVLTLRRQIEDWALHSRGAIAAEAVRAMAMGGSDLALMTVDSMARKFKNKQVRRVAGEAFEAAAQTLGTTPEALGDRIIPTLDFDPRGQRVIDYGTRSFTATLSPSLTITLEDENGKTLKSLPRPGAKDDIEKAERAKSDFTALKKSLKAVVSTQAQRLEQALATGRRWNREAWTKLFVQNPIMHSFAIGLVWGVYDGDTLSATFRYMEDGGFTTMDEDDFDLEAIGAAEVGQAEIGLVHPLDLDPDALAAWKQQLEDYDISQPIPQLERAVYTMTDEEREALAIDRFGGKHMLGITLMNKLQKSGWYRGSVQDAGVFYTFYKEIGDIGMQLYFSGMYVSPDTDEVVTVGQAGFYRAGAVERGSYVYDDVNKEEILPLAEISPRMFSEVILDLTLATATSTDADADWKGERGLQFFAGK